MNAFAVFNLILFICFVVNINKIHGLFLKPGVVEVNHIIFVTVLQISGKVTRAPRESICMRVSKPHLG